MNHSHVPQEDKVKRVLHSPSTAGNHSLMRTITETKKMSKHSHTNTLKKKTANSQEPLSLSLLSVEVQEKVEKSMKMHHTETHHIS